MLTVSPKAKPVRASFWVARGKSAAKEAHKHKLSSGIPLIGLMTEGMLGYQNLRVFVSVPFWVGRQSMKPESNPCSRPDNHPDKKTPKPRIHETPG